MNPLYLVAKESWLCRDGPAEAGAAGRWAGAAGGGGGEGEGLAVGRDAEDQLAGRGAQAHPVVDASS